MMHDLITDKQAGLINTLCGELGRTPDVVAQELYKIPVNQLSKSQASEMIDALITAKNTAFQQKQAERGEYYDSAKTGWIRCNQKNACAICGRKKWCSMTGDRRFAKCTKESAGSFLESADGHYIHRLVPSSTGTPYDRPAVIIKSTPKYTAEEQEQRTILFNAVYSALIHLSPATAATQQLVTGAKGLAERGLAPNASSYGMIPGSYVERLDLTRRVIEHLEQTRPPEIASDDYIRAVLSTPGFWKDTYNQITLWLADNHDAPVMLIPYRDARGRIQGCQLRLPNAPKDRRYQWLSSTPYADDGPSPGTPIHFVQSSLSADTAPRKNLITEGALKGDAVGKFLTAYTITTTSGVTCSHQELIAAAKLITRGSEPVIIAYDKDHRTNKHVCRQISRLIIGLAQAKLTSRVLTWSSKEKGLDDALLASAETPTKFQMLDPETWLKNLPEKVKEEASKPFGQSNPAPPDSLQAVA